MFNWSKTSHLIQNLILFLKVTVGCSIPAGSILTFRFFEKITGVYPGYTPVITGVYPGYTPVIQDIYL